MANDRAATEIEEIRAQSAGTGRVGLATGQHGPGYVLSVMTSKTGSTEKVLASESLFCSVTRYGAQGPKEILSLSVEKGKRREGRTNCLPTCFCQDLRPTSNGICSI
jgi:hypothetical protein